MSTHQLPSSGTNLAILVGTISRVPEVRTLPSGDEVLTIELTVRPSEGPAESVPVAWFAAPAGRGHLGRRRGGGRRRPRAPAVLPGRRAPPRAAPRWWPRWSCPPGGPPGGQGGPAPPSRHSCDGPAEVRHDGAMTERAAREGPRRQGLHRRPRPERGQHAQGPPALRRRARTRTTSDEEMFDRIHEMRTRIITSPSFTGDRVLGAILFEDTMDRQIEGQGHARRTSGTAKGVVPFLKVDKGLADEADGAQVMKPMPELDALLERAVAKGVFGTKMRSVIKLADPAGVDGRGRPAVRRRAADPGRRPGADHRARGRHPQPGEGGGRGAPQGGHRGAPRRAPGRRAGDAEAHAAGRGRLLRRPRRPPATCCVSSPSPAATPATTPTSAWRATRA